MWSSLFIVRGFSPKVITPAGLQSNGMMLTVDEESAEEKKSTGFPIGAEFDQGMLKPPEDSNWKSVFGPMGLLSRRHSLQNTDESEEDDLAGLELRVATEADSKLIKRLERRLARISEVKPVQVEAVVRAVTETTVLTTYSIRSAQTNVDVLVRLLPSTPKKALFDMLSSVQAKIEAELKKGRFQTPTWEQEADDLERRLKVMDKQNKLPEAILSREGLRKLQDKQAQQASSFTIRMMAVSRQRERKRVRRIEEHLEEVSRAESLQKEQSILQKMDQIDLHHDKALSFIEDLHDKKRERVNFILEGRERQKRILRIVPMHVQVDEDYKYRQDLLYNTRGRSIKELELFRQEQKQYCLQRNKMTLIQLLRPESRLLKPSNLDQGNRSMQLDNVRVLPTQRRSRVAKRYELSQETELSGQGGLQQTDRPAQIQFCPAS